MGRDWPTPFGLSLLLVEPGLCWSACHSRAACAARAAGKMSLRLRHELAGSAVRGVDNYTYSAAEGAQGLVAWLNDKTVNSSFGAVHVTLPTGNVSRGSATLLLPVGLNLVLVGQGMDGANATTLNLEKQNLDIGAMLGDGGRLEFRNMSIRNVTRSRVGPQQLLPQTCCLMCAGLFVEGTRAPPHTWRLVAVLVGPDREVAVAKRTSQPCRQLPVCGGCGKGGGGRRLVEAREAIWSAWLAGVGTCRACHALAERPCVPTRVQGGGGVLRMQTGAVKFESVAISDTEAPLGAFMVRMEGMRPIGSEACGVPMWWYVSTVCREGASCACWVDLSSSRAEASHALPARRCAILVLHIVRVACCSVCVR